MMSSQEWPADDYAVGSYIQSTIAQKYLSYLNMNPSDQVLDIGCGNGAFTKKILDKVPQGTVLGIDASQNMLRLAQEVVSEYPNFSIEKADVLTMHYNSQFDYIVSFWCLQWARDLYKAFKNIGDALKPNGKIFALFPAGDDPYILSYYAMKESGQFDSLAHFISPIDYSRMDHLSETLDDLPIKNLKVERCRQFITLPSLDVYRRFVKGIAFYQGQVPEQELALINEAVVDYFHQECQRKYQGEYQFHLSIYLVTGEK